jgi:hypothetical protein
MASIVRAVRVVEPQRHRSVGRIPDRRAVDLDPELAIPRLGQAQMKASGPGGGSGRTR